jgi:diguanylate cyclase (GGDEF)-like protein
LADDYEIFCAGSGTEALAIVMSESIDLVLLDVVMPEMDGYEVCRKLKNNPRTKNIPVIFVSALGNVEDETKGLELGAIDYIHKPFSPAIIKIRIKNHLELKKYRDCLEKLSLMDGLTGISNRRYFDETFDKEWRRAWRHDDILSIIIIDIDFFKKYNDYYGHLAGDDCLRQVGRVLKDSIKRAGDLVARYGGEEFVVILPSTSQEDAAKLAEKIRANVESLRVAHQMSKISEYVTVSIGIATVRPEKNMDPAGLIEKADTALYQAKNTGRNRVVAYNMQVLMPESIKTTNVLHTSATAGGICPGHP